ncbi:MAG: Nif3-like dinuclear metal center hexameric protein [Clostridia bacterium]|nr:Nif3-like dinuclear metal center hexameric protein [Clostridia bacterium]
MHIDDFIKTMESLAPAETAMAYDNCGLLIGTEKSEIRRVLVALDCTLAAVDEAIEKDCDIVLTHHPLLFKAVNRILPDSPDTAAVYKLIRSGIGLFAAHTNLDAAEGGVNTVLCTLLGIKNASAVPPDNIMRVGELDGMLPIDDFSQLVCKRLGASVLVSGPRKSVKRIAVVGGSGGGEYRSAYEYGADCLVTGECKHSDAIAASSLGISIIVAGHYETENPVLVPLIEYLRKNTTGVEYFFSEKNLPVFRHIR